MNRIIRLSGLVFLFTVIHFHAFGQEQDLGKQFFPDNENAQWLVSLLGQPISKKVWKQFKRKTGDRDISKDIYDDYSGQVYPKNTPAVRTGHYSKVITYGLKSWSGEAYYNGMSIRREYEASRFSFMNAPTIKDLERLVELDPNLESTKVEFAEEGGHIDFLHHNAKLFVKVTYRYSDGNIFIVEVSKGKYDRQRTIITQNTLIKKTKGLYTEKGFTVDPAHVLFMEHESPSYYQIGEIKYKGKMKDGVPHGDGSWSFSTNRKNEKFHFKAKGDFENGKPIGVHQARINDEKTICTYEDGKITKLQKYNNKFYITFNEDGSYKNTAAMPVKFGNREGLYYGKIDENQKPHDGYGTVYFTESQKVSTKFVHGQVKSGTDAFFVIVQDDIEIDAKVDSKLRMMGEAKIRGRNKQRLYTGTVYFKDGKIDLSKEGKLSIENFQFTNDLQGQATITGKIEMYSFGKMRFGGKDLEIVFSDYPDTRFRGSLDLKGGRIVPVGWHTVTEYENGVATGSLKGKYSPKGDFLEGDNFYQKGTSEIYDVATMTDPRDGKTYQTKTFKVKEKGEYKLLTWMLEDLHYEPLADEKSKVRGWDRYIMYYSQDKAKRACPSGWRLPYSSDYNIIPIDASITDSQEKNIARIRKLSLSRNGYVYRMFGKYEGELRNEDKEVDYWLQNDRKLYISEINFGNSRKVENNYSYFTCRCVKEEKL